MPARIALDHIAWFEPALAALIMRGAIYGMARLAPRIYAGALIHSGGNSPSPRRVGDLRC